jgi:hypothetical protein
VVHQYLLDEEGMGITQGDEAIDVSARFPGLEVRAREVFRVG